MKRPGIIAMMAIAAFAAGFLYDMSLQALNRPYARWGVYFHPWSSEVMMQTVPIEDLRSQPLQTLLYTHIQPPGFDFLRAVLVQFWPRLDIHEALKRVDTAIYVVWAALLGGTASIIFLWISNKSGLVAGALSSALFVLHPAVEYYATFLDSTFLTAFLVLLLCFLLYRLSGGHPVGALPFTAVFLALFFTRSIFQWPALIVIAISLALLGMPRRQVLAFVLLSALVSGLFMLKQYLLFQTVSTSSLAGYNLSNSVGAGWNAAQYSAWLPEQRDLAAKYGDLPSVLLRKTKLDGLRNFNNIAYLDLNDQLFQRFREKLRESSAGELAANYVQNAEIYFQPSSEYRDRNAIVERLPWKRVYNRLFSAPVLPLLLFAAAMIAAADARRAKSARAVLGLALPGIYVLLASVLFEKSENMRFKFWLEPVMFVFITSQLLVLGQFLHKDLLSRKASITP